MAEEQQTDLTPEDFDRLAAELDSKGEVTIPEERPDAQTTDKVAPDSQTGTEVKPDEAKPEGEEPEGKQVEESKPDTRESEDVKAQKESERFERNWQKQQEIAEANRRKEAELAEREKAVSQKEAPGFQILTRTSHGYSAEDYEKAVDGFLIEGNQDMAQQARQRARELRTKTHQRLWTGHVEDIKRENPGIEKEDHPLHQASMKVLKEIPVLNILPDGAKHALRIAKAESSSSLVSGLQTENQKLKQEIQRLNKALELGGSGPNRLPSDKSFEDLTPKEQEKELTRMAEEADRMGVA